MYLKLNLLVFLFLFALNDGSRFRFDYVFFREANGWLKLHEVPATWTDARLHCFREGAVLASPENEQLLKAMTRLLRDKRPSSSGIFTGISSIYSKGDFYSITGTPLSRLPERWAPAEPDNADNAEDCLFMLPDGTLADVNCSNVYPFICYRAKAGKSNFLTDCGTVDLGYTLEPRTGSCYKFHTLPQTWWRAFTACSGEGGYLAIINSETESKILKDLYAKHPPESMPGDFEKAIAHIGFSDWGEHGLWVTAHGRTLKEAGFALWEQGQPNNKSSQFCGSVFRNGLLNDYMCGKKLYPNSPCPLLARSKKVIIHERNAVHTPRVVRICQAPLDLHVDTSYLTYMEMAKRLGAWQMVDRISCGICQCGECCDCAAPRYEPRDAERAGRRRAHMREFDVRVRTDYQLMRIMYDKP